MRITGTIVALVGVHGNQMHYYTRNIGDYNRKAGRLSMLQDGAYQRLMDCCYNREEFPTTDEALEWTWASTPDEVEAVMFVLKRFFKEIDGRWVQKRIKETIDEYRAFCDKQTKNGKKGGRPKKPKPNPVETQPKPGGFSEEPNGNPAGSDINPEQSLNQEPRTNNQEPSSNAEPKVPRVTFSDEDMIFAQTFWEHVRQVAPKYKTPNLEKWAESVRLMRERDGLTMAEIMAVFDWFVHDSFWSTAIFSVPKFRDKFAVLHSKTIPGGFNENGNRVGNQHRSLSDENDDILREILKH